MGQLCRSDRLEGTDSVHRSTSPAIECRRRFQPREHELDPKTGRVVASGLRQSRLANLEDQQCRLIPALPYELAKTTRDFSWHCVPAVQRRLRYAVCSGFEIARTVTTSALVPGQLVGSVGPKPEQTRPEQGQRGQLRNRRGVECSGARCRERVVSEIERGVAGERSVVIMERTGPPVIVRISVKGTIGGEEKSPCSWKVPKSLSPSMNVIVTVPSAAPVAKSGKVTSLQVKLPRGSDLSGVVAEDPLNPPLICTASGFDTGERLVSIFP